jgi:hypothetical protein
MSNGVLKVKTYAQASDWGYRVINGVGQTMVSRRGYATEARARKAGQAAADALAPIKSTIRYSQEPTPVASSRLARLQAPKSTFWQSLFG